MRYVAPINIIAPTVYMNSNGNDNHNRIVFMLEKNTYTPHNNQTTQRLNNLTANTFNDYNQTIKPWFFAFLLLIIIESGTLISMYMFYNRRE